MSNLQRRDHPWEDSVARVHATCDVGLSFSGELWCSSLWVSSSLHVLRRIYISCTSRCSTAAVDPGIHKGMALNLPLVPSRVPRSEEVVQRREDFSPPMAAHKDGFRKHDPLTANRVRVIHRGLSWFSGSFQRYQGRSSVRKPANRLSISRVCLTRHLPLSAFLTLAGVCTSEPFAALFHAATTHRISCTGSGRKAGRILP